MIQIDYRDSRPIYEQLIDRYEMLIAKGVMKPDDRMPSVRQMASDLSVNPNTIQKVYAILESRGYIYSVKGRGSFVADPAKLIQERTENWKKNLAACLKEGRDLGLSGEEILQKVQSLLGSMAGAKSCKGEESDRVEEPGKGKENGKADMSWSGGEA
ncbi:MAG: GntR family transcriptional regulator [Eubacterium sp.]|nr:GntR family transcriptional regulator [Eubacterium sp.]